MARKVEEALEAREDAAVAHTVWVSLTSYFHIISRNPFSGGNLREPEGGTPENGFLEIM